MEYTFGFEFISRCITDLLEPYLKTIPYVTAFKLKLKYVLLDDHLIWSTKMFEVVTWCIQLHEFLAIGFNLKLNYLLKVTMIQ